MEVGDRRTTGDAPTVRKSINNDHMITNYTQNTQPPGSNLHSLDLKLFPLNVVKELDFIIKFQL